MMMGWTSNDDKGFLIVFVGLMAIFIITMGLGIVDTFVDIGIPGEGFKGSQ